MTVASTNGSPQSRDAIEAVAGFGWSYGCCPFLLGTVRCLPLALRLSFRCRSHRVFPPRCWS